MKAFWGSVDFLSMTTRMLSPAINHYYLIIKISMLNKQTLYIVLTFVTAGLTAILPGTQGNIALAISAILGVIAIFNHSSAVAGARAFVNDGHLVASGNFGAQDGNGGSNTVPVWSDGSNWYIG